MKFYISFGQNHTHRINGHTYDCDSLMLVEALSEVEARLHVINLIGRKWAFMYPEGDLTETLPYFPRGVINADDPV